MQILLLIFCGTRLNGMDSYGDISRAAIDPRVDEFDNGLVLWPNCKVVYDIVTDNITDESHPCFTYKKTKCGKGDSNCNGDSLIDRTFSGEKYDKVVESIRIAGENISQKVPGCGIERYDPEIHQHILYPNCVVYYENGCFVRDTGYAAVYFLSSAQMGLGWCHGNVDSIIHEFLHSFGLVHEHQSKIAGEYLITCQDKNETCYPSPGDCYRYDHYIPYKNAYDLSSITHYDLNKNSHCNMTLTEKGRQLLQNLSMEEYQVGRLLTLSDLDAEALTALYENGPWGPSASPTVSPEKTPTKSPTSSSGENTDSTTKAPTSAPTSGSETKGLSMEIIIGIGAAGVFFFGIVVYFCFFRNRNKTKDVQIQPSTRLIF